MEFRHVRDHKEGGEAEWLEGGDKDKCRSVRLG